MPVVSGDRIGEHCCGLDVTEELLRVEEGIDVMCDCRARFVCTWLGRERFDGVGWEAMTGVLRVEGEAGEVW